MHTISFLPFLYRYLKLSFLSLPIVPTLPPVTFAYSLSSYAVVRHEMKEAVTKIIDTLPQEYFHGAFQKLLERYNKCIAAGGDYFEGDKSFMCVLLIKVPIQKKNLETYYMHLVYIKYMISKHILLIPFLNEPELFFFFTQLNGFTYFYQIRIILFTINNLFALS